QRGDDSDLDDFAAATFINVREMHGNLLVVLLLMALWRGLEQLYTPAFHAFCHALVSIYAKVWQLKSEFSVKSVAICVWSWRGKSGFLL
ncbi:MAG: hypothetical protein ACXWVF_06825, partial [Telluria sp.]